MHIDLLFSVFVVHYWQRASEREREIQDETEKYLLYLAPISATNVVDMEKLRLIMNFNEDAARGFI